jgi:hypothetical protein
MTQTFETSSVYPASDASKDFVERHLQFLAVKAYDFWQRRNTKSVLIVNIQDVSSLVISPVDQYIDLLLNTREKAIALYAPQSQDGLDAEITRRRIESMLHRIDPERQIVIQLIGCPEQSNVIVIDCGVPIPYFWLKHKNITKVKPKRNSDTERQLEIDLQAWLLAFGVNVESQVTTNNHRLDLWIPGKLMLELKAGKVTGDDICQAIDYYATYQRKILLVGKGLSDSATRGIDGFNRSVEDDALLFVTWGAVKTFLKAYLHLQ